MSKLDELINKLIPYGVEFKELVTLAEIGTGSSDRKDSAEDGKYPFYVRSKDVLRINTFEYDEEAIVIPGEGGIGEIFHFVSGKYALHQRAYRIHPTTEKLSTKFLYYYMFANFKKFIMQRAVSATVTSIRKPMIEKFEVPLPPLEIQNEIVRILDKFTSLEAELDAELDARRKQYEYYRDSLLLENKNAEWKTLSEIGTFERGRRFVHGDDREEGTPCIHYGELYTYYGVWANEVKTHIDPELKTKLRFAEKNDVIIVGAGENNIDIGVAVAWLGDYKVAIHDACYIFRHKQNPKYISYLLRTYNYHLQIKKYVSEGKICSISSEGIGKAKLPFPSLEEQQKIVAILDRFESLCNDITSGLPAEIEARHKQYEYYRDKLLTFKRKEAV